MIQNFIKPISKMPQRTPSWSETGFTWRERRLSPRETCVLCNRCFCFTSMVVWQHSVFHCIRVHFLTLYLKFPNPKMFVFNAPWMEEFSASVASVQSLEYLSSFHRENKVSFILCYTMSVAVNRYLKHDRYKAGRAEVGRSVSLSRLAVYGLCMDYL